MANEGVFEGTVRKFCAPERKYSESLLPGNKFRYCNRYRRPLLRLHLLCSAKFYTFNATMYGNSYGPYSKDSKRK